MLWLAVRRVAKFALQLHVNLLGWTPASPRGSGDKEADHTEDDRSHCCRAARTYVRYTACNPTQMYGHDMLLLHEWGVFS